MSIRDQLFEKLKTPRVTPYTFDGVPCFIKIWSDRERIEWKVFVESVTTKESSTPTDDLFLCRAVQRGLANEDGSIVFSADDVDKLTGFPCGEIDAAFNAIIDAQKFMEVKDAKKN